MTRPGWIVAVLVPAAAVGAVALRTAARPSAGVEGTPKADTAAVAVQLVVGHAVGQAGCSSVGCHGAPAGDVFRAGTGPTSWASSAILWTAADPHRNAYAVLEGALATRMMVLLTGEASPGVPKVKATDDARCLACHSNPALAEAKDDHAKALRAEGVSCEACHGNASGWLRSHTSFTPETRPAGYESGGMAKLYDLGERAVACAGCHVGAPADPARGLPVRDMNHDMIAAGHPRLNFDFATYQFMLPRHWYERDRTKPGSAADPDFEARAWLVGRVAQAEAACRLTADRARRADPWPEFAESSCVACHHTLVGEKTTYPKPDVTVRRPGSLPWQPIWPVTRPADFAALNPGAAGGAVSAVQTAMHRPRPAANAGDAAAKAATDLTALRLRVGGLSGSDAFAVASKVIGQAASIPPGEWDRDLTEQVYHALAARERARIARGEKTDPAAFVAVASKLRLDRGTIAFSVLPGDAAAVRALIR